MQFSPIYCAQKQKASQFRDALHILLSHRNDRLIESKLDLPHHETLNLSGIDTYFELFSMSKVYFFILSQFDATFASSPTAKITAIKTTPLLYPHILSDYSRRKHVA